MQSEIKLSFLAAGAEQVVAEIKKIQDAIKQATKGLDLSGLERLTESIDKATAAAEAMNERLGEVGDTSDDFEDVSDGAEQASGSLEKVDGKAKKTRTTFERLASVAKKTFVALVAFRTIKAGFDFVAEGIMNAFKAGSEFSKMAAALNTDAGSARVLAQAFTEAGMAASSVVPMVSKMQRKIAEGSAAFEAIGIDVESLKGKSALEQMEAIGEAVRGVTDQEGRMKVLMTLFEEAGPQLSKLFNNPNAIKNATATLGSSVEIMRDNAESFDRAAVLISNISTKIGTFFEGVASGVVGPLGALLEALNQVDLAEQGKKFGDSIKNAAKNYYKAFASDQLFELIQVKFSVVATKIAKFLVDRLIGNLITPFAGIHGFAAGTGDWLDGVLGITDSKASWMDQFKKNYNSVESKTKDVFGLSEGGFFDRQIDAWEKLEGQLIRSLDRKVPDEDVPWENPKPPEINIPDFKLDLSGLLGKGEKGMSFTPQSDALARVGGTIGGMANAQLAPMKKTADNTSRLVTLANDIKSTLKTRPSAVAVYA